MRKIMAFIACSMLVFSLGFTCLPSIFSLLAGWLGPIFGTSIYVLLSMIFILFGDPMAYPTLIGIWVSIGILCGLIVRRRLGSAFSASLVFSAMLLVMVVAALHIIETATDLGLNELPSILPPIPPGTTLGAILTAPIVGEIFGILQSASTPFTGDFTPLLWILISNSVKNLALVVISSLAGCELGKLTERFLLQKILKRRGLEEKTEGSGAEAKASNVPGNLLKHSHMASLLLVNILIVSMIFSASCSLSEPYYAEGVFGFIDTEGTAYMLSAFIDSEMFSDQIDLSSYQFENAVLGVLVSHETSVATLPRALASILGVMPIDGSQSFLGDFMRYYETLPKTIFLIVYIDEDGDVARRKADMAASSFSETFSAPLSYLTSIPQEFEVGGSKQKAVFLIYYSDVPFTEVGHSVIGLLPIHRDGLADFIGSAYGAGIFAPHETNISANGTVMTAGFFSPAMILSLLGTGESELPEFLRMLMLSSTDPMPMLGLFSYWTNRYHSSSFIHDFNIAKLLNYTEPIGFSPEAEVSVLLTIAPNATIEGQKVTAQPNIINVATSVDLNEPKFKPMLEVIQAMNQSGTLNFISVKKGSSIAPENLSVNFVQALPLNLRVKKTIKINEMDIGRRLEVTVKVINVDETDAAENVMLDDSAILQYYGSSVEVAEGTLTRTWPRIPRESSETHTYSIIFKKEGIYTLPSAVVTYNYMDKTYDERSNYLYLNVRPPPLLSIIASGIPSAWGVLARTIDRVQGFQGSGSIILTSVAAAILGVLSFFEYRNLRRWIKMRKWLKFF